MTNETNPEVEGQPNPEIEESANSPSESVELESREADAPIAEESEELTQERIQQLLENDRLLKEANITDPKALYADYTRKSQTAAELEREREQWLQERQQYQQALNGFMGQQEGRQDPERAAWAEYQERINSYDQEGALEAQQRYLNLRDQRLKQETLRELLAAQEINSTLTDLSYLGDTRADVLARERANMDHKDWAEAQVLLKAYRRGDLREKLNAHARNKEADRAKRARIDSFLGDGDPGSRPGSADRKNQAPPSMTDFLALAPAARKRLYGVTEYEQLAKGR